MAKRYEYLNEDHSADVTITVEYSTKHETLCYNCHKNTAVYTISHDSYYYEFDELLCEKCYNPQEQETDPEILDAMNNHGQDYFDDEEKGQNG